MKKKFLFTLISSLTTLSIFGGVFGIVASSISGVKADSFDYSVDENSSTLNQTELLTKLTGESIGTLESNYVNQFDEYILSYQNNSHLNDIEVVDYYSDLYVTAEKHTYSDKFDRTLNWVPYKVSYKDQEALFELSNGKYEATLISYDGINKDVKVQYKLDLSLDKSKTNSFINLAYNYAKAQNDKIVANEKNRIQYENDIAAYNQYLLDLEAYNAAKAIYDEYAIIKNEYDLKYQKYQAYLQALAKYEQDYQAYLDSIDAASQWDIDILKYQQYLYDLDYYNQNHAANQAQYDAYISGKAKIQYRLDAMKIAYTAMTDLNRVIYDAVMGDSVTSVLSMKEDLLTLGVKEDAIDRAGTATTRLRESLGAYRSKSTDEAKYAYYKSNHIFIRNNVNELARCLNTFLDNGNVVSVLKARGKFEKYYILVAQLIYFADAIKVAPVYNYEAYNTATGTGDMSKKGADILDSNYKINLGTNNKKTYKEILGNIQYLDTSLNYAYPGSENYNDPEVTLLEEPAYVPNPGTRPVVLSEPVRPTEVENPGEGPEYMERPVKPEEVFPAVEPSYYTLDETEQLYLNAYLDKALVQREEYDSDPVITFYDDYSFNFGSNLKHLVKFYNDQGEYISEQIITSGATFDFSTLPTYDYEKIYQTYSIVFVDSNEAQVDLTTLDRSINLYAKYLHGDYIEYQVTWNVGGVLTVEYYHYNQQPVPLTNPTKPDEGEAYYDFKGWDKPIVKVTENVMYKAVFQRALYTFITVIIDGDSTTYKYRKDEIIPPLEAPTKPGSGDTYYDFVRWEENVIDERHITYTAVFESGTYFYITWVVDGTIAFNHWKYKENQVAKYPGLTPQKAGDEFYLSYIFAGWVDEDGNLVDLSTLKTTSTLYAKFVGQDSVTYSITFYVDDQIYCVEECKYGEIPNGPSEVIKEDDDTNYYVFVSWDREFEPVTEETSYHAIFESKPLIFVEVDIDGTVTTEKVRTVSDIDSILPNNPQKANSGGFTYLFEDWDINKIDETHYKYTAIFNEYFVITFIVEGVLNDVYFLSNETVTYENPTKPSTEVYYYTFVGWFDSYGNLVDISMVHTSVSLNAKFEEHYVMYEITWVIDEETITDYYIYNSTLVVPTNVSKPSTEDLYFTFVSWDKEIAMTVTENATYVAIFDSGKNFVKVNFYVENDLIETLKFKQEETIVLLDGASKDDDDRHRYIFNSWEEMENSTAYIKNYRAKFDILNFYYVVWMNEGEMIAKDKYLEGSSVSYEHDIPTKQDDEMYYYTFRGWSVQLPTSISKDITIFAIYNQLNKIEVKFVALDEEYVRYYLPNEAIEKCPTELTRDRVTSSKYYEFVSWDKEISALAIENVVYTALYDETYLVAQLGVLDRYCNGLSVEDTYIFMMTNFSAYYFDISGLLKYYANNDVDKSVIFTNSIFTFTLSSAQLTYLANKNAHAFYIDFVKVNDGEFTLWMIIKNGDELVDLPALDFNFSIKGKFDKNATNVYANDEIMMAEIDDNTCTILSCELNQNYEIYAMYSVSFDKSLYYEIQVAKQKGKVGEKANVHITVKEGYRVNKIIAVYANGKRVEITTEFEFTTDGNITLVVEVEHVLYTIQFIVDGVLIAEYKGYYGDIVLDPTNDHLEAFEKPDDSKYRYVFKGWDKEITTITNDTVYTAVFEQIPLTFNDIVAKTGIIKYAIIGVVAFNVLGGGVVALIFILRHKKRKKIKQ